jgi:hypothetical protein
MPRLLLLAALIAVLLGCNRSTYRGQGPFNRQPAPPPYAGPNAAPGPQPAPPSSGVTGMPAPDDPRLVPPRPPGMPPGVAVAPPQPPRPPGVADANVVPAAATSPNAEPPKPPPSPAAVNLAALKKISQTAATKWKTVDTYEARLVRREAVNGKDGATETVLFQYRKDPHSVFMTNTGPAGLGRMVLYVKGKNDDKMLVVTGAGDNRLVGAGFRAPPMSPDDPRVMEKSRHSIREAGFGRGIAQFAELVAKIEAGKAPADALKHLGPVQRPEYQYPLETVVQTVKPGEEKHSPNGGTRQWFFDMNEESPSFGLPVLVITSEPGGKEVEYYCFDKFKLPARLTDKDFSPERLERKKK